MKKIISIDELEVEIVHRGEDYAKVVVNGREYELIPRDTETIELLIKAIKNIVRGK